MIAVRTFEVEGLFKNFLKDSKDMTHKWLQEGVSGEKEVNSQEREKIKL